MALDPSHCFRNLLHICARPKQHVLPKPNSFFAKLIVFRTMIALGPVLKHVCRVKLLIMPGFSEVQDVFALVHRSITAGTTDALFPKRRDKFRSWHIGKMLFP